MQYRRVRVEFDHFIPKSFCANDEFENIFAMCNLCNRHKGSKMFESREAATDAVLAARRRAGKMTLYTLEEIEILREATK